MSASSRLSLASPACSCPSEVLGMVFLNLRDSESCRHQYLEDVAQVCRSWRIAALANRRLWSRILISLQGYLLPAVYEMCKSRIHRYLERSVAAPLSVEIILDNDYWPPVDKDSMARIQSLISLISQELSRWESLSINFEDEEGVDKWSRRAWKHEPITLLESFLRSPMPNLRRLSLCGVRENFEDFLPELPSLDTFEIKGGSTSGLCIPWSSLTSFRYSSNQYSSDSQHLSQLSQCTLLKDLYIEGIELGEDELEKAFACTLLNVVSFHLHSLPSREPINISLADFRLPSLQNLTLIVPHAFWDRSGDSSRPPYMMMAEMSTAEHIVGFAGTCKVLTLLWSETTPNRPSGRVSARYSRSVIIDMFNAMPDLEELHVSEEISEVFLKVIKEETLVPKLSRVCILDTGGWRRDENRKPKQATTWSELKSSGNKNHPLYPLLAFERELGLIGEFRSDMTRWM